jgi:predicted O-methyltransferase YrrM
MIEPMKHIDRFLCTMTRKREEEALRRRRIDPAALATRTAAAAKTLRDDFEAYRREVDATEPALSFANAAFLAALCELTQPERILETGAGFNSYVLRRYARGRRPYAVVWSVDNDERRLEKTRAWLMAQGVGEARLMSWRWFSNTDECDFDVVFHDLGQPHRIRLDVLPDVCSRLSSNGLLLLDDFHQRGFGHPARQMLGMTGFEVVPLRSLTLDDQGRFAALASRAA